MSRKIILFLSFVVFLTANPVSISGVIHSLENKPVKKAKVTIRNLKDEVLMEEVTNRKGKFVFKEVEPKFYFLFIEHENDGNKRIKINPRKKRNRDLVLSLKLTGEDKVQCYLYSHNKPTDHDPILNVKGLRATTKAEYIIIEWNDIKQANNYILYENGIEIYQGRENRFEKNELPGKEFCYSVQAMGNFGLEGQRSEEYCTSVPTTIPRDIKIDVSKNQLTLKWSAVNGALSYIIYRNNEKIINTDITSYKDSGLEFGTDYFYKISALDALDKESHPSVEVKGTTRGFIGSPILASMKNESRIMLIWNEVNNAESYNIYRDGELVTFIQTNTFEDIMPPGENYCYEITSVDQYGVESDRSNKHCTKVPIQPPKGLIADGDVSSMHLNWDTVEGAIYYKIYEKVSQDSAKFIIKVKSNQYTVRNLDYSADKCYLVTALDPEGEETGYSSSACNVVFESPHFTIQKMTLIEPSGNSTIDALEQGTIQFSVFNDGQSPSYKVSISIVPKNPNQNLSFEKLIVIDTLAAGRIKFVDFDLEGLLKLETGEQEFELKLLSQEDIGLDNPYHFIIKTKSVIPPKLIIADFAVSNDFGTHYIPKNEIVTLTLRIQNVGEGSSESGIIELSAKQTYSTPNFTGSLSLPSMNPGDYVDLEIPILTLQDNFAIDFILTDYLDKSAVQRIDLEVMRHYRSPLELTIQNIGTGNVDYYPDELGEIDVDRRIPLGRKNPNAMAIILATERYDDKNYPDLEFANRDGSVMRRYFKQAFGLSDFQLLPAKTWQMEGGPSENDFRNIFDPHQGDLRKRVLTAEKYSDVEEMDIFIYYRGYGEWIDGKPLLVPKDAKLNRHVTKYPLEQLVNNLSLLSVLANIHTITLFMDITYINPKRSMVSIWDFPDLPEKICILNAASIGETSQLYEEKKHSIFTYALLKGLAGSADDGNNLLELGELIEYIYKSVPEFARTVPNASRQNPAFNGVDLKRTILDLR